jgi:predicted N-acetyltransferase YhbS
MALVYRDLAADELQLLATIDRAEFIDGHYVVEHGSLRLIEDSITVDGWHPATLEELVPRLHATHASDGLVLGAWHDDALVALASLDLGPVGVDLTVMKLDVLHVDVHHRGQGIGHRLVELVAERARGLGASALYISATPTRNTVDAYMRMGAVLAETPDPHLLELEPDDIHLLLPL